jgi:hypothetical protein
MLSTCSHTLVLPIPLAREVHSARESDPRQLEHWLAINEVHILSQAANRQHHLRIGQRSIDEYSPLPPQSHILSSSLHLSFRAILVSPPLGVFVRSSMVQTGSQQRDVSSLPTFPNFE